MMSFGELIDYVTDSEVIIRSGGLVLLTIIVFAENGLFFGFFLPGDYLLFSAGLFCGTGAFPIHVVWLMLAVAAAAIMGSFAGYSFGKQVGKRILNKPDSLFFKREFIIRTRAVYIKYAGNTLLVGRFLPIVRTFAPILAGMINMSVTRFWFYNVLGGIVWSFSLIGTGAFLGNRFPAIIAYLEYIIIGFVAITTVVVLKGLLNSRKKGEKRSLKKDVNKND